MVLQLQSGCSAAGLDDLVAALGWLLNLDFAGGSDGGGTPATSSGPSTARRLDRTKRRYGVGYGYHFAGGSTTESARQRVSVSSCPSGRVVESPPLRVLLRPCGPTAITRLIVSIAVYPINRCAFGAFSHISQEVLKALTPTNANGNTAASVPVVANGVGVFTTLFHRIPGTIGRCLPTAKRGIPVALDRATPTPGRLPCDEITGLAQGFPATFALTTPAAFGTAIWPESKNGEFAEGLPGQFLSDCHVPMVPQLRGLISQWPII